ncbi:MotA/TolQ/ExbB proton channel family protein [Alkalinema sp. FACHB-956]|uniref:MotA/TolQ/ExbB proton channel family protein n=1 Tax=Alkalinema sp. FACHB-956 TaxID=2692768 RepID=UPI001687B6DD|nr:MotA/TolQ/ExbB proton channel family protein [Alkalinema sp. FACHB-956]MBD2329999.1 MotA/TolQ/ExbB proton channel family protein [Alkalinema sp. FACHB-956]
MSNFYEMIAKGGPVMIPLVGLSVATFGCAIERAVFWRQLLKQEGRIVHDVLESAHTDLALAADIARRGSHLPIGRYLLAPLRLHQPTPETFHLALETSSEKEFIEIRRGHKLLESVVGIAPLLGLLGTVTGLIMTFSNLNIGGGGGASSAGDLGKAAAGIGEALITTAGGMIVAIIALSILRVLVSLEAKQLDYFSIVGSELELIYRQIWYEPKFQYQKSASNSDMGRMNEFIPDRSTVDG